MKYANLNRVLSLDATEAADRQLQAARLRASGSRIDATGLRLERVAMLSLMLRTAANLLRVWFYPKASGSA